MKLRLTLFVLMLSLAPAHASAESPQPGASPQVQSSGQIGPSLQRPATSDEVNSYLGGGGEISGAPGTDSQSHAGDGLGVAFVIVLVLGGAALAARRASWFSRARK